MALKERFNFGVNWLAYSGRAFNSKAFTEAQTSLGTLIGREKISGATFLDIGSGSGIFSLGARALGANHVTGIDISEESVEAAEANARRLNISDVTFHRQDIFSNDSNLATYDIVYSWGVLHHTGDLWQALTKAASHVTPGGLLVIAIYNRHWSSPIWHAIKRTYTASPRLLQKIIIYIFYAVIYLTKLMVTGKNPLSRRRGMNFYYDVVDWIGGYPYEYASAEEVRTFLEKHSFRLQKMVPTPLPTGNNEFVFQKL